MLDPTEAENLLFPDQAPVRFEYWQVERFNCKTKWWTLAPDRWLRLSAAEGQAAEFKKKYKSTSATHIIHVPKLEAK